MIFTTTDSWKLNIGSPQEATQKTIGSNFVMYSGNGEQVSGRTDLNSADNGLWVIEQGAAFIYRRADFNLNSDGNAGDRSIWIPNNGLFNLIQF